MASLEENTKFEIQVKLSFFVLYSGTKKLIEQTFGMLMQGMDGGYGVWVGGAKSFLDMHENKSNLVFF